MSVNEHTGEKQQTKVPSEAYKQGWDRIFGKPAPLAQSAEHLPCKQEVARSIRGKGHQE